MEKITRRLFLRKTAAAGAVVTAIAAPVAVEAAIVSPRHRLDAAITELKAAANTIWPDADDWIVKIDATEAVPLLISNYNRSENKQGELCVYVDDGSPLLADDVTGTTAYADWERGQLKETPIRMTGEGRNG